MKKDPKERNYGFTKKEQEDILKKTFKVGPNKNACKEKSLENIIDSVIKAIEYNDYSDVIKDCIKKYWFTKQIEKWEKDDNNKNKELDDELMNIVKEDLKIRIANTMLELKKHTDINDEKIWFFQAGSCVDLQHNDDKICDVLLFNNSGFHISPPYKPFFMKNKNDESNLNGVCIYKHGNDKNEDSKTKRITACFKDSLDGPTCKITFQTDENDKITNVEIETKNENSESIYTISLDNEGQVGQITKNGGENVDDADEIRQLLFGDETNKVLTENIEYELDSQQKAVFDTIKKHIGIKIEKDNKKEEENKDEEKEKEEEADINNQTAKTNIDNAQRCFGTYNKNGKKVYRCFGVDIPCL